MYTLKDNVRQELEKDIKKNVKDIQAIDRWSKELDDDTSLLMISLMSVKNYASEEGVQEINNLNENERYPNLQLNLNGLILALKKYEYN